MSLFIRNLRIKFTSTYVRTTSSRRYTTTHRKSKGTELLFFAFKAGNQQSNYWSGIHGGSPVNRTSRKWARSFGRRSGIGENFGD